MPEILKTIGTLVAGNMAGSNNKASFIVKTLRGTYMLSGTAVIAIWYSAWRNERVAPGTISFPFPGVKKLTRRYSADRPEKELPHESITPSGTWGNSKGALAKGSTTGYVYPFTKHAIQGRVDQGVDFGGTGAIFAIGNARILATGAAGWPGGGGVLYMLLDGARKGQVIFVYEGIKVLVRKHDIVKAGQIIGEFIPFSSTGIEIGFADSSGVPLSHAEYTEGKETVHGKEMKAFLENLKG
jgi:hypothetical protein